MKPSFLTPTKTFLFFIVFAYTYLFGTAAGVAIPALDPATGRLEEGFLWKRTFQVDHGDASPISLELIHEGLYGRLKDFQSKLGIDTVCELIEEVILNEACTPALYTIFRELYEGKDKMGSILGEVTPISAAIFANPKAKKIIGENFKRLKKRNFCLASFTYHPEGEGEMQNISLMLRGKPLIFISGIGNEIIRILEKSPLFADFSYAIFHEKEELKEDSMPIGRFEEVLNSLYINTSSLPLLSSGMKTSTDKCKIEVLKLLESKHKIDRVKRATKEEIDGYLSDHVDDPEITSRIVKLPLELVASKEQWHQAFLAFRDKFCDSEQLLRCFLYNRIEDLLAPLPLTAGCFLTLNIHSVMDPCRYCTNAFFLECLLRDKPAFVGGKEKKIFGGFFHKFYNAERRKPMPHIFIFISSQREETDGGIGRRLISGRPCTTEGETIESPIPLGSPVRLYFRYNGP